MNGSNKRKPGVSCGCRRCRHVPSSVKGEHKRDANRALRRDGKAALRKGGEDTRRVSTGYRD